MFRYKLNNQLVKNHCTCKRVCMLYKMTKKYKNRLDSSSPLQLLKYLKIKLVP